MHRALAALAVGAVVAASAAAAQTPLPFDLGGAFALTDQHGAARTQADPRGQAQLLFFGYANCPGICSTALPLMADVTDALAHRGIGLTPVLITIDPARDRVDTMGPPLARLHPDFVGLSGDTPALQTAWDAFQVTHELAYTDPEHGPIYSHGSMIYLLDGAGEVLTLLPPVLDAGRVTEIALSYLRPSG